MTKVSRQNVYYILGAIVLVGLAYWLFQTMSGSSTSSASSVPQVQSQCGNGQIYDVDTQSCRQVQHFNGGYNVEPSESGATGSNEIYQPVGATDSGMGATSGLSNMYPKDCFPKDQLSPADLLPSDCNSKWAQSVPNCQGEMGDMNFLTAGYHIGINTVGQTLRNANRQLRSEPLNPQVPVSPWLQTTIEPDTNRRPMEIGGGGL
jgi:hypothetical protein